MIVEPYTEDRYSQPNFFHGFFTTHGRTAVIPGAVNTPSFRAVTC